MPRIYVCNVDANEPDEAPLVAPVMEFTPPTPHRLSISESVKRGGSTYAGQADTPPSTGETPLVAPSLFEDQ